jgi:hypothetical protein
MKFWLRRSRGLIYEFEDEGGEIQLTFELYRGLYRIVPGLSPWYKSPVLVPAVEELSDGAAVLSLVVQEFYMLDVMNVDADQRVHVMRKGGPTTTTPIVPLADTGNNV